MGRDEENPAERETNSVVPWMRAPVDVSNVENCPLETLPFLDPRLNKALGKMGISSLFPVQFAVWHETIGPGGFERDLCVNSPTGSGKTLSYALPIVQILSSRAVTCLRALVVLPTRDLALQAVLSSVSVHTMSVICMPAGLLEELDKVSRSFLWGSTRETKTAPYSVEEGVLTEG
ncbi:DEAD-box ATP-dependent RNA helicase 1-like [Eutrema salsugineum]|uniref:DEAD-box ATP-dependent RNA helicase 1-like n=1 Tax=Eutrema salsugineum TaxID=72664 RepID=UPI000CED1332|nr:DEAD-box ATP-dependent RNA helicase 1-like [Eutrema salsugineum]